MKLIAAALIAAIASVALLETANAAPPSFPHRLTANAGFHMVSIRHNAIKLHIPRQRANFAR